MDFMQRSFTIVILWPATSRSALPASFSGCSSPDRPQSRHRANGAASRAPGKVDIGCNQHHRHGGRIDIRAQLLARLAVPDDLDQLGEILAENLLRQRTVVWRGSFYEKVCH
jgi:hypothetical protein